MNILVINYSHPDLPHISAKRMSYFATHLAKRGHRVVLITKTATDNEHNKTIEEIRHGLKHHNWAIPFCVAVAPKSNRFLRIIRATNTPSLIRRMFLFGAYTLKQGRTFFDWSDQALPALAAFDGIIKPDIVWGTFGNIDTLWLTKQAARHFNIPYVIDIKDAWRYFVSSFRKTLAAQFNDAAGITINSLFQVSHSLPWFSKSIPHQVIYSGLDTLALRSASVSATANRSPSTFTILLVGSLYNRNHLGQLISAISQYTLESATVGGIGVQLVYAGADRESLETYLAETAVPFQYKLFDFLPYEQLFALYIASNIISYIYHPKTFHHKLIELLALNRPVLTFPGESTESIDLAREYDGELYVCNHRSEIMEALRSIDLKSTSFPYALNNKIIKQYHWENGTFFLESFLYKLLNKKASTQLIHETNN